MELTISLIVVAFAVSIALLYLRQRPAKHVANRVGGDRPWRRLGAGICLLVGVMFAVGLARLNPHSGPRSFTWYWIVVLLLILWLCGLAIKDLLYTRTVLSRWRAGLINLDGSPRTDQSNSDSDT